MDEVFWLRSGEVAGRAGPDLAPWNPAELAQGGIGAVLTVNDGQLVHAEDFESVGIEYALMPLSPNAPPREGDFEHCLETLPRCFDFVRSAIDRGKVAMIHCTSGKDRTGLFMCYYLGRQEKLTIEAAIAEVKRVRPIALTAPEYEPFAIEVLRTALREFD